MPAGRARRRAEHARGRPLRGKVTVERALIDVRGHLSVGPTKTGNRRVVTLPKKLRPLLDVHLRSLPGGARPDALLFPAPGGGGGRADGAGGYMRHSLWVRRVFRKAVKRALAPEKHALRWHDLRHNCGSMMIAAGAPVTAVSVVLGHASVTTTMDTYSHMLPGLDEIAANALDAYLDRPRQAEPQVVALSLG